MPQSSSAEAGENCPERKRASQTPFLSAFDRWWPLLGVSILLADEVVFSVNKHKFCVYSCITEVTAVYQVLLVNFL